MLQNFSRSRLVRATLLLAVAVWGATSSAAPAIRVTATVSMVTDLAKQVGGDRVEVTGLMGAGVDPHLYKATAADVSKLQQADVIFYNGLVLEGKMTDIFAKLARSKKFVYPVTEGIPEKRRLEPPEFEGHYDPHVWFDVELWGLCAQTVVKGLSEFSPKDKAHFEQRGKDVAAKLRALHEWALKKAGELPKEKRILVTSHDACNYFGRAYGFQVVGLQGISTVTEAGLADMAKLVDFIKKNRDLPFSGIVWDEISKMKNSATNRVKAYRKISDKFDWTTGLTGTPASNGYKDLHGQFLVVDRGERLGTSKTAFRTRFYRKIGPYKEVAYEDTEDTIKKLIGDITLEMSAEDYNPLPDLIVNDIEIEMPDVLRNQYEKLEKEFFVVLDSGKEVEAFNQAALTNKCLQFSNGAMYPVAGMPLWEPVHDMKLDALEDIIDEANGSPILCAYAYRSDAERIMTRFKSLRPINLTECKSEQSLTNAMHRWKTGDCSLMIGHPASMGHGIDGLQKNGHILVWYGLNWSLDLYEQFNARVRRQGQGAPVMCHRILMQRTLDQAQAMALDEKATTQAGLRNAVKQYRKSKGV